MNLTAFHLRGSLRGKKTISREGRAFFSECQGKWSRPRLDDPSEGVCEGGKKLGHVRKNNKQRQCGISGKKKMPDRRNNTPKKKKSQLATVKSSSLLSESRHARQRPDVYTLKKGGAAPNATRKAELILPLLPATSERKKDKPNKLAQEKIRV